MRRNNEPEALRIAFDQIESVLSGLRVPPGSGEDAIHQAIAQALSAAGVGFVHEARLAPRCRVDFLIGSVALEVKCGKPQRKPLIAQLMRYAATEPVQGLMLVVERSANLPPTLGGKPCRAYGLNRLWGIALK